MGGRIQQLLQLQHPGRAPGRAHHHRRRELGSTTQCLCPRGQLRRRRRQRAFPQHHRSPGPFRRTYPRLSQSSRLRLQVGGGRPTRSRDGISTVPSPLGVVGATTCYDLRFPEIWRSLIDEGAEAVVTPAAWPVARLAHWQLFTATRAVENQILVIACNAVGEQRGVALGGHSRVVDPWGNVLLEAGLEEGVYTVEVDPTHVSDVRQEFPVLKDRRVPVTVTPEGTS